MMGAILYGKDIIYLIFSNKYHDSIIILQIIALGIPFIFTIAPTLITALDRQPILTLIYIYGFIINLLSNFILIYFFRSEGAAGAGVITYGFVFSASNYYLIKHKFIKASGTLKIFFSQIIIFIICLIIQKALITDLPWLISLVIISICWFILNFIFVINRNDIRILKEMLNFK
jgi:O-antigen/teichoic acid export membrane protein